MVSMEAMSEVSSDDSIVMSCGSDVSRAPGEAQCSFVFGDGADDSRCISGETQFIHSCRGWLGVKSDSLIVKHADRLSERFE